jgi:hypothetical protein
MALVRPVLGFLSGKVGEEVYAHNRGGQYVRAFTPPTDPNSPQQQSVRLFLTQLSAIWANLYGGPAWDSWKTYAQNVPLRRPGGRTIYITGRNHYIRSNVPRLIHSLARVDNAPTVFNLGKTDLNAIRVVTASANSANIHYASLDPWRFEPGAALLIQVSRPQPLSVNFFRGPYRTWASVKGKTGLPNPLPALRALPFNYTLGVRGFWRARVTRADGRLSRATEGFWDHL